MTTNRSELIARCGNESLKNSLLTPFFFFFPTVEQEAKISAKQQNGEKKDDESLKKGENKRGRYKIILENRDQENVMIPGQYQLEFGHYKFKGLQFSMVLYFTLVTFSCRNSCVHRQHGMKSHLWQKKIGKGYIELNLSCQ